MAKTKWSIIAQTLEEDGPFKSKADIAKWLNMPVTTIKDALRRGDLPKSVLERSKSKGEGVEIPKQPKDGGEQIRFKENGNEATLKFSSGEPLTAKEAIAVAGVDLKEWRIVDQSVNMWQVGRKNKKVDLTWQSGILSGHVEDDGSFTKTYLYQVTVKLTRINRVAVKATLRPIELKVLKSELSGRKFIHANTDQVLFITDPHFGYKRQLGKLIPIHHRSFLSALLNIALVVKPEVVVWGGDVLDLAEFGTFETEPDLLFNLQLAGMELSWLLAQFRRTTQRQIVLEGNHERRLEKALIKNMSAAYQLKPVHELEGFSMLSVPRFLGLDKIQTEWVGDYPSGFLKVGRVKFYHGNIARKGSAKTVSAEIMEATTSKFFGHIHRFELATKYIEDLEHDIWVGSPGCSCDKGQTPGANKSYNWQLGAFLVNIDRETGLAEGVEHISQTSKGRVIFRGLNYAAREKWLLKNFQSGLDDEWKNLF